MERLRHVRGRFGHWFAVLLVLAMLAPTLDMFVCGMDDATVSSKTVTQVAKATDDSSKQSLPVHDRDDVGCTHGHCHHGVGAVKLVESVNLALAESKGESAITPTDSPVPAPQNGLLRPPRA